MHITNRQLCPQVPLNTLETWELKYGRWRLLTTEPMINWNDAIGASRTTRR